MNRTMKQTVAICTLMLLMLFSGCAGRAAGAPAPQVITAAPAVQATEAPAEPTGEPAAPVSYAFPFSAQTLDGESVTEEVFGRHTLTMVNVWASWCGPCRAELPELGRLYTQLPEDVGFLSVTIDEAEDLEAAKAVLQENGCAFPCLDGLGSEGLWNGFLNQIMAVPTTVFFDKAGNQVGQWILGVPQGSSVTDAYMAEIQARLDLLNGR